MTGLVSEAFDLVIYGMGSVFVFLTVLVGATHLMSWLLQLGQTTEETELSEDSGAIDPRILAAITVAVKQYRTSH